MSTLSPTERVPVTISAPAARCVAPHRLAPFPRVPVGVVLGCPRSGTTFLMRALGTLPETACLSGIAYPVALPQVVAACDLPEEARSALVATFPAALDQYLQSGLLKARATALQKWWNEGAALGALVRTLRRGQRVDRLIFKEPFLSFAPEIVLESVPGAPIVHLVRDGRDVANSLVRTYDVLTDERLTRLTHPEMQLGHKVDHRYVPWWVEEGDEDVFLAAAPYVRAIWMWKAMVERCEEAFAPARAAARVLEVRYEAFMQEPHAWGERIATHVGARTTDAFRRRLGSAHETSIGKFRKRPAAEVAAAERIAGDVLDRLGYR